MLGNLDDLVLVPLGIALVMKSIPPSVLAEYKEEARRKIDHEKPKTWVGVALIVVIWVLLAALISRFLFKLFWLRKM